MALYPKAKLRLLPENKTQPRIVPRAVIVHSAVDSVAATSLYPFFVRSEVKVESHFFVKWDGTVEQYMDTEVRADANGDANSFAVSIETEDDGDPDRRRWSPAQVQAIVELINWLIETHGIPRRLCAHPKDSGIGWHSMWGAPSAWTPARGKTCPGVVRVKQFKEEIWPIIQTGEEPLSAAKLDEIITILHNLERVEHSAAGVKTNTDVAWANTLVGVENLGKAVGKLMKQVEDLAKKPAAVVDVDVDALAKAIVSRLPAGAVDVDALAKKVRAEFEKHPLK